MRIPNKGSETIVRMRLSEALTHPELFPVARNAVHLTREPSSREADGPVSERAIEVSFSTCRHGCQSSTLGERN